MLIEIKIALNFLLSFLYDKLPRRRVNIFGEELEKYLKLKLITTNWPNINCKDVSDLSQQQIQKSSLNESRAFNINKNDLIIDSCLIAAANEAALDPKEILDYLPEYLKLFIEPGLVTYLLESSYFDSLIIKNEYSNLKILYKLPQIDLTTLNYHKSNSNIDLIQLIALNKLSISDDSNNQKKIQKSLYPIENLLTSNDLWYSSTSTASSSSSNSSNSKTSLFDKTFIDSTISSSIDPSLIPSFSEQSKQVKDVKPLKPLNPIFTTAEFAKTKFGSTKSKNSFNSNSNSKSKYNNNNNNNLNYTQQFNSLNNSKLINQTSNNEVFSPHIKQKFDLQQQLLQKKFIQLQQQQQKQMNQWFDNGVKGEETDLDTNLINLNNMILMKNNLKNVTNKVNNTNDQANSLNNCLFDLKQISPTLSTSSSTCSSTSNGSNFHISEFILNDNLKQHQQQQNQTFDLILNSTIKEMIDNYDDDELVNDSSLI